MAEAFREAIISSLFPPGKKMFCFVTSIDKFLILIFFSLLGSGEKLIIHVKTYKDIQSSDDTRDIKGTPRYLCLTRKEKA